MSPRAALTEALLATLALPATWPLALATFLLRGGILLVVLPIVVLPSPVGLGNVLGPALTTVVLSGVPVELAFAVGLVGLAAAAWIVAGGLVAAILEAESAGLVARYDDDPAPGPDHGVAPVSRHVATSVFAARVVAHVPTVLGVLWGAARLVGVTYRELTSPSDVVSPIALRVLRGAPEVIAAVAIVWLLGETLGGLAARRIVLDGATPGSALRDGVVTIVRRPIMALVGYVVPAAVLAVILLASAAAAAAAWNVVRIALGTSAVVGSVVAVLLFVALWMVGLLLVGITSAWRAAVWSIIDRGLTARAEPSGGPATLRPTLAVSNIGRPSDRSEARTEASTQAHGTDPRHDR